MSLFRWTEAEVHEALGSEPSFSDEGRTFTRVSTDTRSIGQGDLFVALVGDNFDGHDFLPQAAEAGAVGAVISTSSSDVPADLVLFRVPDTLMALGNLAAHRRRALTVPVVGLTGSSGKTTTKEFLTAATSRVRRVHATEGNLNNRIGVPLTLLAAPDDAEVVIIEMGTSEPGEIARLAKISRPDLALLTTVSESHLDRLGSFDGVMEEKLDLLRGRAEGGAAIVGDLPAALPARAREIVPEVGVVGESGQASHRPANVRMDAEGRVSFEWNGTPVTLASAGRHVAYDAWLALAAAEWLGVPVRDAARGIESVKPSRMRNEVRSFGDVSVIVDCYNANPQSTQAGIDLLAARDGVRVAFLGSMLEMGDRRDAVHTDALAHAIASGLEIVVATGDYTRDAVAEPIVAAGQTLLRIADPADGYTALTTALAGRPATVLLKGSRGVRLESLLPKFEADFGLASSTDAPSDSTVTTGTTATADDPAAGPAHGKAH